jgi:hypothetical protein
VIGRLIRTTENTPMHSGPRAPFDRRRLNAGPLQQQTTVTYLRSSISGR